MDLMTICGLLIITVFLALAVKPHRPELALALSAFCGAAITGILLMRIIPALDTVSSFIDRAMPGSEYTQVLFKGLGICLLTQFCTDTCRDAGENGLANKAELAGKISLLIIALPLFERIGEIALSLINNNASG